MSLSGGLFAESAGNIVISVDSTVSEVWPDTSDFVGSIQIDLTNEYGFCGIGCLGKNFTLLPTDKTVAPELDPRFAG